MESRRNNYSKIKIPTTIKRLDQSYFLEYMEFLKTLDISRCSPPRWLQHTETPFKWTQELSPQRMIKLDTDMKLQDYPEEDEDGCYTFQKFCMHLVSLFHAALIQDHEESNKALEKLSSFYVGISNHKSDYIYNRIGPAFEHVLKAVTAQVSFLNGDITEEESQEIAFNLVPFSEMEAKVKAGIQAIKARFYLACSTHISDLALTLMKEANELDPECAAWLFWTGKIIRKIRKRDKRKAPQEEIVYFESAVEKERDPKYILFLAQAYREKAKGLYEQRSIHAKEIENLNKHSIELYRECWNLKKDSAAINRRLGNGVMSLKNPYADYELAEKSLLYATELSNNPLTFHQLGSFYAKYKKDYQKAIEYFTNGAENALMHCFHELIRLNCIFDHNYNPYDDLKTVEDVMKYSADIKTVYGDLGWYYLSFEYDLVKAIEYFWKVLETEDDCFLTNFGSYSLLLKRQVNIYSILIEEVHTFQKENKMDNEDNVIFKKLFDKVAENPELICQENSRISLSSAKSQALKSLEAMRKKMKKNWYVKPNEGRAKEYVHYSTVKNDTEETNWRSDAREIRPSRNSRSSHSSNRQENGNVKQEIYNWRKECKDS